LIRPTKDSSRNAGAPSEVSMQTQSGWEAREIDSNRYLKRPVYRRILSVWDTRCSQLAVSESSGARHITTAHLPLGREVPAVCLSHRVFRSGGLEKRLRFGLNPNIDLCCGSYFVNGTSDCCTSVVSARLVETHTDKGIRPTWRD
jgi:hypothetical protein